MHLHALFAIALLTLSACQTDSTGSPNATSVGPITSPLRAPDCQSIPGGCVTAPQNFARGLPIAERRKIVSALTAADIENRLSCSGVFPQDPWVINPGDRWLPPELKPRGLICTGGIWQWGGEFVRPG